jgi:hypothetical protein
MAEYERPSLDAETLEALVRVAGLSLTPEERAALLPPAAAIHAALDRLDALGLAETEPPHIFRLDAE